MLLELVPVADVAEALSGLTQINMLPEGLIPWAQPEAEKTTGHEPDESKCTAL